MHDAFHKLFFLNPNTIDSSTTYNIDLAIGPHKNRVVHPTVPRKRCSRDGVLYTRWMTGSYVAVPRSAA
jgi:hypothetical protein